MATINLRQQADITINGEVKQMGTITSADTITVTEIADLTLALATGTKIKIWDSANPGFAAEITDFDFLWVESDQDIYLMLLADSAGTGGGAHFQTIEVTANIPFTLTSDDSFGSDNDTSFGGTAELIDQIKIWNNSGATATVRFVIAT